MRRCRPSARRVFGQFPGQRLDGAFHDDGEGAGLIDCNRVTPDLLRFRVRMSERAEAAGGVHQLWHQPDMAEDGMPRATRKAMVSAISSPPSSLTPSQPVSCISRTALRNACSLDS